jgi:hypothetical protein
MLPRRLGRKASVFLFVAVTNHSPTLVARILEALPDISHQAGVNHIVLHIWYFDHSICIVIILFLVTVNCYILF